jgi:uncharacterized membrane protein
MNCCVVSLRRRISNDARMALCSAAFSSASTSVGRSAKNSLSSESSSSSSTCDRVFSCGGSGGGGGAPHCHQEEAWRRL